MNQIRWFSMLFLINDNSKNKLRYYVGKDCVSWLLIELNNLAEKCIEKMQHNQKMQMSVEDHEISCNATRCDICKSEKIKSYKVRYHDHRTGKYRKATRQKCNLSYVNNRYLPILPTTCNNMTGILL